MMKLRGWRLGLVLLFATCALSSAKEVCMTRADGARLTCPDGFHCTAKKGSYDCVKQKSSKPPVTPTAPIPSGSSNQVPLLRTQEASKSATQATNASQNQSGAQPTLDSLIRSKNNQKKAAPKRDTIRAFLFSNDTWAGRLRTDIRAAIGLEKKPVSSPDQVISKYLKNSSTLAADYAYANQKGYTINYGGAGKGTYINLKTGNGGVMAGEIVIDSNKKGNTQDILSSVAHELGHLQYAKDHPNNGVTPKVGPDGKAIPMDLYIQMNVQNALASEGAAQLAVAAVQQDFSQSRGPKMDIPGSRDADYAKIYTAYTAGKISLRQAEEAAGTLMGNYEHPSTNPKITYGQYYSQCYENHYNGAWSEWGCQKPT